jgi:signal transduction histidine kinase
VFKLIFSSEHE